MHDLTQYPKQFYVDGTVTVPILQTLKWRLRREAICFSLITTPEFLLSHLLLFCPEWRTTKTPRTKRTFEKVVQIPQGTAGCRGKVEPGLGVKTVFKGLIIAANSRRNCNYLELKSHPSAISWPHENESGACKKERGEGMLNSEILPPSVDGDCQEQKQEDRAKGKFS